MAGVNIAMLRSGPVLIGFISNTSSPEVVAAATQARIAPSRARHATFLNRTGKRGSILGPAS